MEQSRQGNAVISGSGQLAGGLYDNITISGSSNINGDINALDVKISGSAHFYGHVSSESVTVNGSAKFDGDINTNRYVSSGSSIIKGHVHGRIITSNGSMSCKKDIRAEEIKNNGSMHVNGDIEAESFNTSGGFHVKGLLNASEVKVNMSGRCFAHEIGGDEIIVKYSRLNIVSNLFRSLFDKFGYGDMWRLQSAQIEATDVSLEWSKVGIVRGSRVEIGSGCIIGLIEYTETVDIHPNAIVDQVKRIV
ncbi:polymer-forming cytoskeletal protein [Paenibacillus endoradicis]|uniref:polymer-forming cytoskeletal protein n=1 Tax=Paenibacillus endoradicis TaxID=2972487 RepID=UPI00215928BC|nr:polymer-forming cytoskeletal protein [Paenibacillus endoradicis]MCR8657381.1 polymer-forming cytoskeletal protein [Paenibacillus endoradicis]